jgi:hypothetical protein
MDSDLPLRLLGLEGGKLVVFCPRERNVDGFDILSYRWGETVAPYQCGIQGVDWDVTINKQKLDDIKRLMETANIKYLWADCLCIKQAPGAGETDNLEKASEIARMYQYYKRADVCHVMLDMKEVWDPQTIVSDLEFIDHILDHITGAALASEANLTRSMINRLSQWATGNDWYFPISRAAVRSAAVDAGVLNCYATCVSHVRSLFDNVYFSRVWTFQEMLLGKNITMWAINDSRAACIGPFDTWKLLADDTTDKAIKLYKWIDRSREVKPQAVEKILWVIAEDILELQILQAQVQGIGSAQIDIINGGANWWRINHKGVSNVFSAISISPRNAFSKPDIFLGLLGVFTGLFPQDEIARYIKMAENTMPIDIETVSFDFFRRLSIATDQAWTRLAIGSRDRGAWDWIPVAANPEKLQTTDVFAGVINLGRLKEDGRVRTSAETGILGTPRWYMKMNVVQEPEWIGYRFLFKGCNCGKKVKTGMFSRKRIPTNDQCATVVKDETGRTLIECATWLASIIDPGGSVVDYRRRLLRKLRPNWAVTDANAKPANWIDRCVSGSWLEDPDPFHIRVHNRSANYHFRDMTDFESRLENDNTKKLSCHLVVNCGCTIVAPFAMMMEAILAVEGSSLGETAYDLDDDGRIVLQDGLGLVQVGDVGKGFHLVAFGGDRNAHKVYAAGCRKTKETKRVIPEPKHPWPRGRALVRDDFKHDATDLMKDYGYVNTGGSGNLLICRNHPVDSYKIVGVCIDRHIDNEKGMREVTIR